MKNTSPSTLKFINTEYVINDSWLELFTHFMSLDEYNKMPTKAWYATAKKLIEEIGMDEFLKTGIRWINSCIEKGKENKNKYAKIGIISANDQIQENLGVVDNNIPEWVKKVYGDVIGEGGFFRPKNYNLNTFQNYFYQSLGGRILRGFVHSSVITKDEQLITLVDNLALAHPNESQDAIHIYSLLPEEAGVTKLLNLKARARNKNILKRIDKTIATIANKSNKTKAEIEESMIQDFGINSESKFIYQIDDTTCVFEITNHKESNIYYQVEGKRVQKAIPKRITDTYPEKVKRFKDKVKEIKTAISGQKKRIESFYLTQRTIPYSSFKTNYIENPLVRIVIKDLIWNFKKDGLDVNLILSNNTFTDIKGNTYTDELQDTQVTLWHPINSEATYIWQWRNYMISNQILQAFKQAFREIYIITEAELNTGTYSNRYASHILIRDQFIALCKARGWSGNDIYQDGKVTYKIPESNYSVEYWLNNTTDYTNSFGYNMCVSTDQVIFFINKEHIPLMEVPALVFSEVMRDIDMFVGVTSIGNDPTWYDRGNANTEYVHYWISYSDAELTERSKTRAEILKSLIPKMKIAEKCSFDGKYLRVEGTFRTYKIHLGSGNILMEPNDQYLCIVPDKSKKSTKVFVPFEGDEMLSVIISKAVLLAEDTKITDQSILSQIKGR